jgi:SAM-dependent methyltransferase
MKKCIICGNTSFGPGPNGRMSKLGLPPRCNTCQSLERHRAFRCVAIALNKILDFQKMRALQFSTDRAFDPSWFSEFETSIWGGENSLDVQNIDRKDCSYDFVICNHVIEHVADDYAAVRELVRICSETGLVFLSFPDPLNRDNTSDWGYPKQENHGHYRIYGRDARERFREVLSNVFLIEVVATFRSRINLDTYLVGK